MATKFSIGDFSKASGISPRTLRFYHEKGILIPAAIEQDTGYRFYDECSLERAQVIIALRRLDFSLDEISMILAVGQNDEDILAHLEIRKKEIAREIKRHRDMIQIIDSIVATERESRRLMNESRFEVEEQDVAPILVAGIRLKGRYRDCGPTFGILGRKLGRHIAGKPMCLYYDAEYREDDADFEPCFPVTTRPKGDDFNVHELTGGHCITLCHAGPYEELGRSYAKLISHAARKGFKLGLPSREVYLKGPGMIFKGKPRKYITEIQAFIT